MSILVLQSSRRGRESWLLCYYCLTINVMWLFLTMLWVGLQYVIVVFPDHTHLLLCDNYLQLEVQFWSHFYRSFIFKKNYPMI